MYSLVDTGTDLAWLIHMVHFQQRDPFIYYAILQYYSLFYEILLR